MPNSDAIAIEVRNVVKRYGSFTALKNVSLSIFDNEFFTLLGPSGCGKTTLIRLIGGFETLTKGEIYLHGAPVHFLPPHRRPVNTVFQNYALFPHMTVLDNVSFGVEMRGASKSKAHQEALKILELVQLSEFAKRMPSQLSGGQQQRVALARALAPQPKVLLLDEPLSALDLQLRKSMQIELKNLQRETGITFIFVTHDQEEALTMSDRIAVMSGGELQQLGQARDIYEKPRTVFVANFIGETNLLEVSIDHIADGRVRCHLRGGHTFVCQKTEKQRLRVGSKAHVSVRPERLFISGVGADVGAGNTANENFRGTVLQNIYVGTDIITILRLNGGGVQLSVRTSNSERSLKHIFEPGREVFVNIEAGAPRLLIDK